MQVVRKSRKQRRRVTQKKHASATLRFAPSKPPVTPGGPFGFQPGRGLLPDRTGAGYQKVAAEVEVAGYKKDRYDETNMPTINQIQAGVPGIGVKLAVCELEHASEGKAREIAGPARDAFLAPLQGSPFDNPTNGPGGASSVGLTVSSIEIGLGVTHPAGIGATLHDPYPFLCSALPGGKYRGREIREHNALHHR